MARENLEDVRADNKMMYDQQASDHKFLVGDAVYYKHHIIKVSEHLSIQTVDPTIEK